MKKIDHSIWVFQLPSGLEIRLVNVPQEDLDFLDGIEQLREQVAAQASEIESLRISYDAACMLAAQMHEAVMGEVIGPYHGVVEDVRTKVAAQAAVIEKLREIIPKLIDATPGHAGQCSGLKCRERYCYSCNGKEDADAYLQTVWDLCHDANKALTIPTGSTQILAAVRRAERERCAKVCESHPDPEYTAVHFECASRIRAME